MMFKYNNKLPEGNAIRSGSGEGNATVSGEVNGDAIRSGSGKGSALRRDARNKPNLLGIITPTWIIAIGTVTIAIGTLAIAAMALSN